MLPEALGVSHRRLSELNLVQAVVEHSSCFCDFAASLTRELPRLGPLLLAISYGVAILCFDL